MRRVLLVGSEMPIDEGYADQEVENDPLTPRTHECFDEDMDPLLDQYLRLLEEDNPHKGRLYTSRGDTVVHQWRGGVLTYTMLVLVCVAKCQLWALAQ